MSTSLKSYLAHLRQADTPAALFEVLHIHAKKAGLDRLAYAALKDHERYAAPAHPAPGVMLTYPKAWVERYFARGYQKIDPVLVYTTDIAVPYLWRWLPLIRKLDQAQQLVLDEAREAGLHQGMSVPLIGPHATRALLSFASGEPNCEIEIRLGRLGLYSALFHVAFTEMVGAARFTPPTDLLTSQEHECLRWLAEGKTSWEIGIILEISEHTVRSYLRTIFLKLDVTNRAMAVARAMRLGLLDD